MKPGNTEKHLGVWVRVTVIHDRCAAQAWGDRGNTSASAVDQFAPERLALDACSEEATNCKIYDSGCSYPDHVG